MNQAVTRTFRYCRYPILLRILALGWKYSNDLGPTHGEWCALVEWPYEGARPWIS
jgi:hypothetical protein